ncbi:MFS transporter [Plantactinospora sp. B5E13]|uniref:MFS transporter n=1 Tax=unclassified Plantactinospora TaxID=2631981 RepID=UPI00325F3C58
MELRQHAARSGGPARPSAGGAVLLVVCIATLLAVMDYSAPVTVLPQTAAGLGAGPVGQVWMINGIALGLAATVLVSGSVADNFGRRRIFLVGTGLLGLASLGSALAQEPLLFIAARVLQGLASAAIMSAGLGLLGHAFRTGPERGKATARWGATLGAGIALGPLVSGALAELVNWRAYHVVAAVAAVALVPFGAWLLDESRSSRPRPVDWAGTVALAAGLALLLVAVTDGRTGWLRTPVLLPLVLGLLLLGAFVVVERRSRQPMLELALFRSPMFRLSALGGLVTGLALLGPMSYLPTQLQGPMRLGPLAAAGIFAVWSGMAFLVALQMRRFGARHSSAKLLVVGLLLTAAGEAALLGLVGSGTWSRALPGLAVAGIGTGVLNATLARLAVESVPADHVAMGSGASNTARYVGASLGLALVGSIASSGVRLGDPADVTVAVAALVAVLGAVLAATQRRRLAVATG